MICPCCGEEGEVLKVSQATMYPDPEQNMFTGCEKCRAANDEHWADMWAEYWGEVL